MEKKSFYLVVNYIIFDIHNFDEYEKETTMLYKGKELLNVKRITIP